MGIAASAVLLATLWYGWRVNGGDISYGRLNTRYRGKRVQWYHAANGTGGTRIYSHDYGVPVSTSFLVY